MGSKFTSKYQCYRLIHYEFFDEIEDAIKREKQLKGWNRKWKEELIQTRNSSWTDLWDEIQDLD